MKSKHSPFTERVVTVIRKIPRGRVASYGQIAAMAGNPNGARQVVRILHSLSRSERLPWHRVVNKQGMIALTDEADRYDQAALLRKEGVEISLSGKIASERFFWNPRK